MGTVGPPLEAFVPNVVILGATIVTKVSQHHVTSAWNCIVTNVVTSSQERMGTSVVLLVNRGGRKASRQMLSVVTVGVPDRQQTFALSVILVFAIIVALA